MKLLGYYTKLRLGIGSKALVELLSYLWAYRMGKRPIAAALSRWRLQGCPGLVRMLYFRHVYRY